MFYAIFNTRRHRCTYVGENPALAEQFENDDTVAAMARTFHGACLKAGRRAARRAIAELPVPAVLPNPLNQLNAAKEAR